MRAGSAKVLLAMTGIFLAGAIAGGVSGVAWVKYDQQRISAQRFADRQLRKMIDELELSADQVERIRPMISELEETMRAARRRTFEEFANIMQEMHDRVEAELTPEQKTVFADMQERERRHFEKRVQDRRGGTPGKSGESHREGDC